MLTERAMCTPAGDAGSENAEQKQEEASAMPKPEQPVAVQRSQAQSLQVGTSSRFLGHSLQLLVRCMQQWLLLGAADAAPTASGCLQEPKAQSSPAAAGLQHTLLQQTSGWESEKHAALERFFNRQQSPAVAGAGGAFGMQGRPAGKPPTAVFGAFYDIIKNPPKAGSTAVREPENGPLRHATRTSRYNPYARPQARTSAGHMNR